MEYRFMSSFYIFNKFLEIMITNTMNAGDRYYRFQSIVGDNGKEGHFAI